MQTWEARGFVRDGHNAEHVAIERAAKDFTADTEARKLKDRTIYEYRLLSRSARRVR